MVTKSYQVLARFQAAHGPATSLALSHDGSYLASGGDNESVHIWDIDEGKNIAILSDRLERWGQITAVKWLEGAAQSKSYALCFGTGRGYLLLYEKVKDSNKFQELTCRAIFPFNDPVEAIDYNIHKERLIASSHSGKVAMYSVGKQGTFLESIWTKRLSELANGKATIPRAVHFFGAGDSVIICGLETGVIFSKTSNNGNDGWNQQIKSSIGNTCMSPNENMILVDNLVDGFDMYTFPGLEHFDFLEIPRSEAYIHGGTFVEGSNAVACGSDHGYVYLFSTKTSKCIEKLRIGSKTSIIQSIDAFSNDKHHLIAGATNDNSAEIVIWRKVHVKVARSRTSGSGGTISSKVMIMFNLMILVVALALFFGFRFRQESPYDKMELLRRRSEEALEDAKAWELAKARAAQDIHEARIVNIRRWEMAYGDDRRDSSADRRKAVWKRAEKDHGADIQEQEKEVLYRGKGPEGRADEPVRSDLGETTVHDSERRRAGTSRGDEPERLGDKSDSNYSEVLDEAAVRNSEMRRAGTTRGGEPERPGDKFDSNYSEVLDETTVRNSERRRAGTIRGGKPERPNDRSDSNYAEAHESDDILV